MEKIKLGEYEFTADDLRDLADALDNPERCLPSGMGIDEYAERLSNK